MSSRSDKIWQLAQAGGDLPARLYRRLRDVWSEERHAALSPAEYLREAETETNRLESAAHRTWFEHYDLLADAHPPQRIRDPLHGAAPLVVLVFDGMSVREVPALLDACREQDYELTPGGDAYTLAPFPTDTASFLRQRLDSSQSPSLFIPGVHDTWTGQYLYRVEDCINPIDPAAERLLLWCRWPDVYYTESEATGANLFERIGREIVQAVRLLLPRLGARDVIVTSDHGYMYSGADLTWSPGDGLLDERHTFDLFRDPQTGFANSRATGNWPLFVAKQRHLLYRQLFERQTIRRGDVTCIRGRFHVPGVARTSNVYVHRGWSWLELFVPWLHLRHK